MTDAPAQMTPAELRTHMATGALNLSAAIEQMPRALFDERQRRELRGPDDPYGLEFDAGMRASMKFLAAAATLAHAISYMADTPRRGTPPDGDAGFARLVRDVMHRTLHDPDLDHVLHHFNDDEAAS